MSSSSICRISSPATISRRLPPFTTMLAPARGAPSWLSCRLSSDSFTIKPPRHPTYDLMGIIKLALAEDAGVRVAQSSKIKAMADAASPAHILETRKTAPGLRLLDKWEVETRTLEEVKELLHHASQTMGDLRPRISSY
ncbi:hypothetical protein L6164_026752 [Bauhinia variegata]|uniref:Uncharacterized protein n=1 Tax=Bauhinia variegata TaxID=167791 RepID=A0ACB9LQS8_BAUVA|nr:hypothetical protein L6164_026752 [Bauhinia variegata]